MTHSLSPILLGAALGTVCAKQTMTTDATTSAQRGAEVAGASEVPQASLALQYSKENLEAAQALYDDGKKDEAASMLLRSEADAELAILLAEASAEKDAATAALEQVRKVRADN